MRDRENADTFNTARDEDGRQRAAGLTGRHDIVNDQWARAIGRMLQLENTFHVATTGRRIKPGLGRCFSPPDSTLANR